MGMVVGRTTKSFKAASKLPNKWLRRDGTDHSERN